MAVFIFVCVLFTVAYSATILVYYFSWRGIKNLPVRHLQPVTFITIVIPVRNEQHTIGPTLQALQQLNYPSSLFEVIVVNDHSVDDSLQSVSEFISKSKYSLRTLSLTDEEGKKAAITQAVREAKGNLIITLDADCVPGADWLNTIESVYVQRQFKIICAPVVFDGDASALTRFQQLESAALQGCTAAAIALGHPIMCNGANLAFDKQAFLQVRGYEGNHHVASGDDIFLMEKIAEEFPGAYGYVKCKSACVVTQAQKTLGKFIEQRRRWASKTYSTFNFYVIAVAATVFVFNLLIVGVGMMSLFHGELLVMLLVMIGAKFIVDYLMLQSVSSFMNSGQILLIFLPAQLFSILYFVAVGVMSPFAGLDWKGRKIEPSGKWA